MLFLFSINKFVVMNILPDIFDTLTACHTCSKFLINSFEYQMMLLMASSTDPDQTNCFRAVLICFHSVCPALNNQDGGFHMKKGF